MPSKVLCLLYLCVILYIVDCKLIFKRHGPPPEETPKTRADPEWHTITQKVDHFNPIDLRTWSMRYLSNDEFYEGGGPIFIYLGGEWEISTGRLTAGQMYEIAKENKGYMFYTEHRYYGSSYPTADFSTPNLKYLSLDQAIADVVYFIKYVKEALNLDGKVVVVGASYSASMATWIRLKYPHLVDIAYASSGPVRAVADFYEYYEVINDNIGLVSEECLTTISDAISQLESKLETEDGIDEMSEKLQTCNRIQTAEPHRSFLFNFVIAELFAGLVQYAQPDSIQNDCDLLASFSGTALDKLIGYIRTQYDPDCIDDYDTFIQTYTAIGTTNDMWRPWLYQTCTEYGYYQTSTSERQPFGQTFGLDFFVNWCTDLFGANFGTEILETGIKRTNIFYGSQTPEVTKVLSIHGTVDPWHPLGILSDLNDQSPSILMTGTSHCADLNSISDGDLSQLVETKLRAREIITEWLADD
ncbi:protease s28 pro-x carboxypeptidase-related [Holotrichia oblita]|uniref:Protease s28 pro-x carboxypeptidase-related n=1 Tax=Holotrichia oblita TaxID=644536 RepID=A0ACB9TCQ1_HOLOL|nr:protease s28 pro-x carboxypeptidase-related [Holotrichia oblita]